MWEFWRSFAAVALAVIAGLNLLSNFGYGLGWQPRPRLRRLLEATCCGPRWRQFAGDGPIRCVVLRCRIVAPGGGVVRHREVPDKLRSPWLDWCIGGRITTTYYLMQELDGAALNIRAGGVVRDRALAWLQNVAMAALRMDSTGELELEIVEYPDWLQDGEQSLVKASFSLIL
ncbi:MAG: hypothetical protein KDE27_16335 [Planctomycetes bacterium]|nr:hypothetical protein [Planctomycetota bacterium]